MALSAFDILGAMSGLAVRIFASMNQYINLKTFNFDTSIAIIKHKYFSIFNNRIWQGVT